MTIPEIKCFILSDALFPLPADIGFGTVLYSENTVFCLLCVDVDKNRLDHHTLKLHIFRCRTNFYTKNTDSECHRYNLSIDIKVYGIGEYQHKPFFPIPVVVQKIAKIAKIAIFHIFFVLCDSSSQK